MGHNKLYTQRIARLLLLLFSIVLAALSIFYVSKLIYPFLIGAVIAFAINPLVELLQRKLSFPRGLSVITTMLFGLILILLFATLIVAEIISGSNYLAKSIPSHITSLTTFIEESIKVQIVPIYNYLANQFNSLDATYQKTILDNVGAYGDNLSSSIGTTLESIFKGIPVILKEIPNFATVLIVSFLATFFISKDWNNFKSSFNNFLPYKVKEKFYHVLKNLKHALLGFLKAHLILITITTIIALIGLLVLGVEHAVTISLAIGFVDLLPYLGAGLVFVPWIIYSFISGNTALAIGLTVLYIIIVIQRQISEPKVLSSNIGLDPLATLIALFVGFRLLGFIGLIIGPVILVIFKALYQANVFNDLWIYVMNGRKHRN